MQRDRVVMQRDRVVMQSNKVIMQRDMVSSSIIMNIQSNCDRAV